MHMFAIAVLCVPVPAERGYSSFARRWQRAWSGLRTHNESGRTQTRKPGDEAIEILRDLGASLINANLRDR